MNCYFKHSASFRDQVRASVKIKLRSSAHDGCIGNAVLVWKSGFHRDGGPLLVVENFLVARKSSEFKVWVECSNKDLIAHLLHVPKPGK